MQPISPDEFEGFVSQALDDVPEQAARQFRNVAVVVEDQHPDDPDLLGLYEGVSLVDRAMDGGYTGALPDRISLYRIPLCLMVEDLDELRNEIRITVMHEFAHHIGIDDARLHELGWD